MEQANWQRRRDILICIICGGIIIVAAWNLFNQFIDAILLLLLSMTVAFLLTPVVNALEKLKIPRVLAALLTYIVVIAVIGALTYALIFSLINQVQQFSNAIISFVYYIPMNFTALYNTLIANGIPDSNIQAAIGQIQAQASNFAQAAAENALNILVFISNAFLNFVIVIVMSFYLTVDGKRIRNNIMNAIPQRTRPSVLLFEDALNRVVGNYIRGQLTLAVLIGIMVALVCVVTGLGQFALVFGVLGFLFETIPMVGPLLASISPIL
ncbi:MAG TPA: AI-2E family transporter, partial [Ktedonobacteraceae bacterium]